MKVSLAFAGCLILSMWQTAALAAGTAAGSGASVAPPAPTAAESATFGVGIQRTMTLLATSTPERRHKVRILFYGQSITEQEWSKKVAEDLRRRFPHADLEIQNRAIGGFAAQSLIRPAEHDLYPFYPDLLIFHVYGANGQYEQIIRNVRTRTTAEVLMQKDHVTAWPQTQPDEKANKGLWWDYMMNQVFLPQIAKNYGCAIVDVRTTWLEYLKANGLEPKACLKDGVHLNDRGNALLAALVSRYLVHRPDLPADRWRDLVRDVAVGKEVAWKDGRLVVEFEGNRVDVLAAPGGGGGGKAGAKCRVLIDGRKPSEFPECYVITRPQPGPWSPMFVSRVGREKPLVLEDWTLKVTSVSENGKQFQYEVKGSITGPDGRGDSTQPFVSNSGRVKLAPEAFFVPNQVPAGYESKWKVVPLFVDEYGGPEVTDRPREYLTTLAQGLANGRHKLELVAEGEPPALAAVRVYRPPVR